MTERARYLAGSFRIRLVLGLLLVAAVVAGAWIISLYGPLTNAIVEQQEENLVAVARAGALVLGETERPASDTLNALVTDTDLRMTLVAQDGRVIADSQSDPASMENHAQRPEVADALSGRIGSDRRISETQNVEQLYVAVPASFEGSSVALRVSQPLAAINDLAARSRRAALGLLVLAVLLAGVLATRLAARAAGPVERLSAAAEAMAGGDLRVDVPDETGELAIMSRALADLREQMRRRLEELGTEQRNLRSVLDGLTDAVFLLHDDRVVFANNAAGRLFRTPSRGWRDQALADTGLPASVLDVIVTSLGDDESSAREWGPDPSGRTLRISVLPLNHTETHRRTLVVVSDTTERTRLDRVRRDFVANASHELKTPAAAIHLLAESAAHAAADGDTDVALSFALQIEQESARLGRLVTDLLDLSRLEATPASDSVTDMREAVANAVIAHGPSAKDGGLDIVTDTRSITGVDVFAKADPTDVAIALDNLLDNAIKYTEEGVVTVRVEAEDDLVRVIVSDTGIGIPAGDLPRIFERFYRVDRARSRRSGGTGLGLALVRHVVERSAGTVEVTSEPGVGTSFAITLPRA
ncbi:MAG: PAS domain-containing protein [Coriobacteriia bacterium]|nr:PAS domain-containing protein [Coriobacteriia bacterium]